MTDLQMIVTYVGVDIFCAIIAVSMGISIQSDFGSEFEVKSLRKALVSYVSFLAFGIIWLLTQHNYIPYVAAIAWMTNMISLFSMIMTTYYWFLFAMARIRRSGRRPSKLEYLLARIPIVVAGVLCFTTPITGLVFQITANQEYYRGPLFAFTSSIQYIYSLDVCIYAICYGVREKNKERRHLYWLLGLFIIFPMAAGVVQLLVGNTPILAPSIITALFIVFVYVQKSQIYNDSLTGLNNRKRLFSLLENKHAQVDEEHPMVVYMVDADRFKSINDQYGHAEGDRALALIAESLMQAASKYHLFAARYGGDEFSIIDYSEDCANPEEVAKYIKDVLKEQCNKHQISYSLTVSIGYAVIDRRPVSIEEMLTSADEKLYEQKARQFS